MGLSRSALLNSRVPFDEIIPRAAVTPVGQITLPMTFRIRENFYTEYM
jgi:hypothetical protein